MYEQFLNVVETLGVYKYETSCRELFLFFKDKIPHLDTVFLFTRFVAIIEPFNLLCNFIISFEQFLFIIKSSGNNIKKKLQENFSLQKTWF